MELAPPESAAMTDGLLMRELTHRINNEFACVANMVSLAAARAANTDAKTALIAVADRVEDYVRVHRALQMPPRGARIDASAYLGELCRSISRSKLARKNIELLFFERPLALDGDRCWRLGLAVYELINNASRHAFDDAGGEIRVELLVSGRSVECRVSDNGNFGFGKPRGRGLKIVEDLAASMNGCFSQDMMAGGSRSSISFGM
jgi:two-component sensor histidine kinase